MLKANATIVTDEGNIQSGEIFDPKEFKISAKEVESLIARKFIEPYEEPEVSIATPAKASVATPDPKAPATPDPKAS